MSPSSTSTNKIALFIDGPNLYATAKALGFDIDYKRLLAEFQNWGTLVHAFYYTAIIEDQEFSSIRPLIDWLDYNGFTVVTKPTKEFMDATGRRKVKGNMDIELAVDAMELAEHIDEMVLFSGDGDFQHCFVCNGGAKGQCVAQYYQMPRGGLNSRTAKGVESMGHQNADAQKDESSHYCRQHKLPSRYAPANEMNTHTVKTIHQSRERVP